MIFESVFLLSSKRVCDNEFIVAIGEVVAELEKQIRWFISCMSSKF